MRISRWRQPRWLAGLVLTLVLLGHDGIMASAAHADPTPAAHAHEHGHDSTDRPATNVVAASDNGQRPEHPIACGVGGTAIPTSAHWLDLAALSEIVNIASVDPTLNALPRAGAVERLVWPPGTRRALLQIYRI